ncbi:MAG TPA: hypothetical protein VKV27_13030 [Solirubrobacteraceae bacterium]|nr:hypothetical protein [Solirubrobacteraceae bacterium]
MAQQQPIRMVVERKGGCFSGWGTALAVLVLIGIAISSGTCPAASSCSPWWWG